MARQSFRFERQWKKVSNSQQSDNIGQCDFIEQKKKLDAMMSKVTKLVGGVNKLMEEYNEINQVLKEQEDVILRENRPNHPRDEAVNGGVDPGCESGSDQDNVGPEPESKDSI